MLLNRIGDPPTICLLYMLQQQYDFACLEDDDEKKAASAMVSLTSLGKLGERDTGEAGS